MHRRTAPWAHRGLSLIELMIAMAVGFTVSAIAIGVLATTFRGNADNLRFMRMDQDLRGVLNAVSNDLARARYWSLAGNVVQVSQAADLNLSDTTGSVTVSAVNRGTTTSNAAFAAPFNADNLVGRTLVVFLDDPPVRYNLSITGRNSDSSITATIPTGVTLPRTDVKAGGWTILNPFTTLTVNSDNNCVLMSYDVNEDGVLNTTGTAQERFGYRLNTAQGTISATRTSDSCTAGTWESITDGNYLEITQFTITPVTRTLGGATSLNVEVSEYLITIVGRLRADTNVVRTLQEAVKVRNDRIS